MAKIPNLKTLRTMQDDDLVGLAADALSALFEERGLNIETAEMLAADVVAKADEMVRMNLDPIHSYGV